MIAVSSTITRSIGTLKRVHADTVRLLMHGHLLWRPYLHSPTGCSPRLICRLSTPLKLPVNSSNLEPQNRSTFSRGQTLSNRRIQRESEEVASINKQATDADSPATSPDAETFGRGTNALKQAVVNSIQQCFSEQNISDDDNVNVSPETWKRLLEIVHREAARIDARSGPIYGCIVFVLREQNRFRAVKSFVFYLFREQKALKLTNNLSFLFAVLDVMRDERCRRQFAVLSGDGSLGALPSTPEVFTESDVLSWCKRLQQFSAVLDDPATDLISAALSTTELRWRDGIAMLASRLETARSAYWKKVFVAPKSVVVAASVAAAFRHDDEDAALRILASLCTHRQQALVGITLDDNSQAMWYTFYRQRRNMSPADAARRVFEHMNTFACFPSVKLMQRIQRELNNFKISPADNDLRYQAKLADMTVKGECSSCGRYVARLDISPDEFNLIRDTYTERVINGRDLHLFSHPGELAAFREFIANNGPFDVVIDGLNVAYLRNNEQQNTTTDLPRPELRDTATRAWILRAVVDHVVKRRPKRVCIIGRHHMRKWPREHMAAVARKASLFYVRNESHDDSFLLYAALLSGPDCVVLSSDMYMDYSFSATLHEPQLRRLFMKWQRMTQMRVLHVDTHGVVKLEPPVAYDTSIQMADDGGARWHVPYFSGTTAYTTKYPEDWLCVQQC